jgi:hypothetical protein
MNPVVTDNTTFLNATGLLFGLGMSFLLLVVPRRYAIVPILVLVCFMTMGERVIIFGLNFTMLRILLFFGWLRLLLKGEFFRLNWNTVDKLIIAWTVIRTVNYTLVWGTANALTNRLGFAYDIIGVYFLFRFIFREPEDVYRAIRYSAIFIGPVAIFMVAERLTAQNMFALFGGVPLTPEIRDGVLRCQGPFAHSILAGTFGASTLPLFVGMWWYRRSELLLTIIAAIASTTITILGGSSGPLLAYLSGVLALCLWAIRRNMRMIRWSLLVMVIALQLLMNSPVWFVLGRLTVFSGSTGWFRGFLIDMTIRHIGDWWLLGSNAAPQWHPYVADVTNQYIAEGLSGGILAMILFVMILGFSFRTVGRMVRSRRLDLQLRHFMWALGAGLLTHAVSFMSVSYFDQNFVILYLLLASISTLGATLSLRAMRNEELQIQPAALVHVPLSPLLTR